MFRRYLDGLNRFPSRFHRAVQQAFEGCFKPQCYAGRGAKEGRRGGPETRFDLLVLFVRKPFSVEKTSGIPHLEGAVNDPLPYDVFELMGAQQLWDLWCIPFC